MVPLKVEPELIEKIPKETNTLDIENLVESQTLLFELSCKCYEDKNGKVINSTG